MKQVIAIFCLLLGSQLQAKDGADFFVEAHAGALLGAGAELGVDFGLVRVRGQFNKWTYKTTEDIEDNSFDLELVLDSRGVLVDLHPFDGAFHFTGGVYDNNNRLDGESNDIVLINGSPAVGVSAETAFSGSAPYVGIGWLFGRDNDGLVAHLELGVMDNGDPDVTLTVPGNTVTAEDIAAEEKAMEEDLEGLGVLPVAKFGIGYYF